MGAIEGDARSLNYMGPYVGTLGPRYVLFGY